MLIRSFHPEPGDGIPAHIARMITGSGSDGTENEGTAVRSCLRMSSNDLSLPSQF